MARYTITIADRDARYCEHFLQYVIDNENSRIKAESITDAGYLGEFLNSSKQTDILLLNIDMYAPGMQLGNAKTVIILSGDNAGEKDFPYAMISKYQAANKLIEDVIKIYTKEHPSSVLSVENTGNCKYIVVYSPITRCGKTVCALSLAGALASRGNRVLYMNLEYFPSVTEYFDLQTKNFMSEVVYYAKSQKFALGGKIAEKADRFSNDNLYIISPFENTKEIANVEKKDWEFLATQLKRNSMFEYVIVDLPSAFNSFVLTQLKVADKVILIESTERSDRAKREMFMKMLSLTDKEISEDKLTRLANQYDRNMRYEAPSGVAAIPYMMSVSSNNGTQRTLDISGQMGRTLVELVR